MLSFFKRTPPTTWSVDPNGLLSASSAKADPPSGVFLSPELAAESAGVSVTLFKAPFQEDASRNVVVFLDGERVVPTAMTRLRQAEREQKLARGEECDWHAVITSVPGFSAVAFVSETAHGAARMANEAVEFATQGGYGRVTDVPGASAEHVTFRSGMPPRHVAALTGRDGIGFTVVGAENPGRLDQKIREAEAVSGPSAFVTHMDGRRSPALDRTPSHDKERFQP